jgi:NADH:ubiquinone oxidoreductase subunit E
VNRQGFAKKNTTRSAAEVWRFFFSKPAGLGLGWAHCDSEICYTNSLIPILSSLKNTLKCQEKSSHGLGDANAMPKTGGLLKCSEAAE